MWLHAAEMETGDFPVAQLVIVVINSYQSIWFRTQYVHTFNLSPLETNLVEQPERVLLLTEIEL